MKPINEHKSKGGPLFFMGHHFEDKNALGKVFPAFTGDDAIRAIRAGCTTVMEVENYCYKHSRQYLKWKHAREHAKKTQPAVVKVKRQRKASSAKGGATVRRRSAA